MQFERFESWADVLEYAKQHGHVWYQPPFDAHPTRCVATFPRRKRGQTIKLDPLSRDADPFWVFSDHLGRARKPVYGPVRGLAAGTRVTCRYREGHVGTLLAMDDPRAWHDSLAFPGPDMPSLEQTREHVLRHRETLGEPYHAQPVLWDFGKVYWDRDLRPVGEGARP